MTHTSLIFLLSLPFCIYSQNYKTEIDSLNSKASQYIHIDLDSSLIFSKKAIQKSQDAEYKQGEMEGQYQKGRALFDQARRTLSLQSAEQSLAIAEKTNNYTGEKNALNLIVKIQNHAKQYDDGIKSARKNLKLATAVNDSIEMALMTNFLGIFKNKLGEKDSAFYFTMQSIQINKRLDKQKALAYNYNSLGIYHYKNRNLDSSFFYFRTALKIRTDLKLPNQSIEAYNNLGYVFLLEKMPDSAIVYFKECIRVCLEYGKKSNLAIAYKNISEAYELINNHKLALAALKKTIPINDSLLNIKQTELIIATQKQKNKELIIQHDKVKKQKEKQQILILILIIVFIMALLTSHMLHKRRIENTLLLQKNKASKTITEEYEKMDNWIANELHDDIGGSIAAIRLNMLHTLEEITNAYEERIRLGKSTFEIPISKLEQLVHSRTLEISKLAAVNQNIRKLSHALGPVTFQGQSFRSLVEDRIGGMFPRDYKITIHCFPEDELNEIEENLKFNIYRILQTLSTNIVKHANSTQANIQVIGHKDHLNIIVEDNGIGFNIEKETTGIGLQLANKRLLLFNGKIEINSNKRTGTTIIIDIPYPKAGV
jgi:two-component system NarL family sensor kinase